VFQLQVVRDKFSRFLQANDLEQDVGKLSHTMEKHGQRIHILICDFILFQLQEVRDKFARFLQANDLEQDVGKLSHTMEQHGQRIQTLEEQTQVNESS